MGAMDMKVTNARIWDGEGDAPQSRDLLVRDGCVQEATSRPLSAAAGQILDVGGRVVTPGLVDAHIHLLLAGESLMHLDLSAITSRDSFEEAIEKAHESLPDGRWLIATGWNHTQWDGQCLPDRTWLRAAGDRPVACWRCDWHSVLVNDAVLQLVDMTSLSAQQHIMRDGHGDVSGVMVESAAWELVNPIIPPLPAAARDEAMSLAIDVMLQHGVTAARCMEYRKDIESHFLPRACSIGPRLSLVQLDRTLPLETAWRHEAAWTDRMFLSGCKAFYDGTLGSRTARLRKPYADDPTSHGVWLELALNDQDEAWCTAVVESGLSPVIHAIGDAAVGRALRVLRDVPDELRPTIEHAEVVAPEDLAVMRGMRMSVQPTHRAEDAAMAPARLGDRAKYVLPLRAMQDAGARLSFGTDWPIVPIDPLATLRAAILGTDARGQPFFDEQRLSPVEAMRASTVDAAEACGFESGLQRGQPADFVVWTGDPFTDISTASVQATFIDGKQVSGHIPTSQGACHE
jgi:predicted amidohydrolase YtcJ